MFFDPRYFLFVGPALILGFIAQMWVKSAYAKYSRIQASSGLSGAEAARVMLDSAGLGQTVRIEQVGGFLSDHYDPRTRVLRLSPENFSGRSLAAVGVACHEAGHAVQHAQKYGPLETRNAIVPMAMIAPNIGYVMILIGLMLEPFRFLAPWGLILFGVAFLFQLINLPVEFDASRRAKQMLPQLGIISTREEAAGVSTMLNAAAMTYVAATVQTLMTLLYYATLVNGNSRRS